jgi:hypothetical protein
MDDAPDQTQDPGSLYPQIDMSMNFSARVILCLYFIASRQRCIAGADMDANRVVTRALVMWRIENCWKRTWWR